MKCKVIIKVIGLIILSLFLALNIAEAKNEARIKVRLDNELISLDCKEALISDLISLISKKTGIAYKIFPKMKNKRVTTKFDGLNFKYAIQKIVGENYAIIYKDNKIEKLYLLPKGKGNEIYTFIEAYHKGIFPELKSLKNIVTKNVLKEHPNAKFYEVIPHYNLDGKLISYVFTYYLGREKIPLRKTLDRDIKRAWYEKKEALENIHAGYNERDSAKIRDGMVESKKASSKISRENDFVSLEVGASYEPPPIIAFWSGLPLDISQYPRALDVANQRLKDKEPKFKSTYTTGLFTIVFAFEGNDKKTYYITQDNWKIFTSWEKIVPSDGKNVRRRNANKERNRLKWADFLDI